MLKKGIHDRDRERTPVAKRVSFTPSVEGGISSSASPQLTSSGGDGSGNNDGDIGGDQNEVIIVERTTTPTPSTPQMLSNLKVTRTTPLPTPNIADPKSTNSADVMNNLVESVNALESRMPLAFQQQQQVLMMQNVALQVAQQVKDLLKQHHEQSLMRYQIEQEMPKQRGNFEKGAEMAKELLVAKGGYEALKAQLEAEIAELAAGEGGGKMGKEMEKMMEINNNKMEG